MTEQQWNALMLQLEQEHHHAVPTYPCVRCWYQAHREPYPALSSSLCPSCSASTLAQRRVRPHVERS